MGYKTIIWPSGTIERMNCNEIDSFDRMKQMLQLDHGDLVEHVTVHWNGRVAHMFVDEEGLVKGKRANLLASVIYWNNTLQRTMGVLDTYEDLSHIAGPAILYEGVKWE